MEIIGAKRVPESKLVSRELQKRWKRRDVPEYWCRALFFTPLVSPFFCNFFATKQKITESQLWSVLLRQGGGGQ